MEFDSPRLHHINKAVTAGGSGFFVEETRLYISCLVVFVTWGNNAIFRPCAKFCQIFQDKKAPNRLVIASWAQALTTVYLTKKSLNTANNV